LNSILLDTFIGVSFVLLVQVMYFKLKVYKSMQQYMFNPEAPEENLN